MANGASHMTGPASRVVDDEEFMRAAIDVGRRGLLAGEPPIGACLVRDGDIVVALGNAVIGELDITAHAEMRVIREACRLERTLSLTGCRLYVTVEPCPMCIGACHYAGITELVYGASLADLHALTGAEHDTPSGAANLAVSGNCLRDECVALLEEWAAGKVGKP
jgi:guanine deaminase